jgi:hypothetical protein
MRVTTEIRWFWPFHPPAGLENWFRQPDRHGCAAGGGGTRQDQYLLDPTQTELGVKHRAGMAGVEIKGLVAVLEARLDTPPFAGRIELWTKWGFAPLSLNEGATIVTAKQRWLRTFDTTGPHPVEIALGRDEQPLELHRSVPVRGCNVELTKVSLPRDDVWWTLGFEAFGTIGTVVNDLRAVVVVLSAREPPSLGQAQPASYPVWLQELEQER